MKVFGAGASDMQLNESKEIGAIDALSDSKEVSMEKDCEEDREQEAGTKGTVKWTTNLLYLSSVGFGYASPCE
jgi:hypothetical protein